MLIAATSFLMQAQVNRSSLKAKGTKIRLHTLSDDHPNKKQMETLLNTYDEKFIFAKVNEIPLKQEWLIQKRYDFRTKKSELSLTLIFCKNQQDALDIGEVNFNSTDNHPKYGVNGAVLFVVNGKDERKINDVLSWFSGDE